jgi:hypothetical protein
MVISSFSKEGTSPGHAPGMMKYLLRSNCFAYNNKSWQQKREVTSYKYNNINI